jgi:hypothetical protein
MSFKRYIFKSGLEIIAPLKCGTRWLDGLDLENRIDTLAFPITEMEKNVHSGTTFIWRPVKEHFMSAIQTEFYLTSDAQIWDIINKMEDNSSGHWNPQLYKKLYPLWLKFGFKFYKLRALSELTSSTPKHKWTSNQFNFILPIEHITVEEALKSLSSEQFIKIQKLIDEEEKWLKLMIEAQYSEKTWEDYSDLEDNLLKIMCELMDSEHKVVSLEEKVVSLDDTVLKLKYHIKKLKGKIIELEGKIIELEDTVVKLETKLRKLNKRLI